MTRTCMNGHQYPAERRKDRPNSFKDCAECRRQYMREYYKRKREADPEYMARRQRYRFRTNAEWRAAVFEHYGKACACCGESEDAFLTIDHINGGGSQQRKKIGTMYRWLVRNDFPPEFQTLCWNCNAAKHIRGCCPHQRLREVS